MTLRIVHTGGEPELVPDPHTFVDASVAMPPAPQQLSNHPAALKSRAWRAAVRGRVKAAVRPTWKPITLRTVSNKFCRFIPGEPNRAETVYCGRPTVPGSSYCDEHDRICKVRK